MPRARLQRAATARQKKIQQLPIGTEFLRVSEGDPVDRREQEGGRGRDEHDDKQAHQQQTVGARANTAHEKRLS
jgi:hypothetical protein